MFLKKEVIFLENSLLVVDGCNVALKKGKIAEGELKNALRKLGKSIMDSGCFGDFRVEIAVDANGVKKEKRQILGYKDKLFYLVFCPEMQGGADAYLLKSLNKTKTKQFERIVFVTNDRELRMNILFSFSAKESCPVELLTVGEFLKQIQINNR